MPQRGTRLTRSQWSVIEPHLVLAGTRRPRTDARIVFQAMISMLHHRTALRNITLQKNKCSGSTVSRTLWDWALANQLKPAWSAYLGTLNKSQLAQWKSTFDFYTESWQDRKQAQRWADRVHSLWYQQLLRALKREIRRRK